MDSKKLGTQQYYFTFISLEKKVFNLLNYNKNGTYYLCNPRRTYVGRNLEVSEGSLVAKDGNGDRLTTTDNYITRKRDLSGPSKRIKGNSNRNHKI